MSRETEILLLFAGIPRISGTEAMSKMDAFQNQSAATSSHLYLNSSGEYGYVGVEVNIRSLFAIAALES